MWLAPSRACSPPPTPPPGRHEGGCGCWLVSPRGADSIFKLQLGFSCLVGLGQERGPGLRGAPGQWGEPETPLGASSQTPVSRL